MIKEFKDFIMRGNVADMAVGIIIGGAFGTIVNTMVSDVLMPPLGLLIGGIDFSNFYLLLKEGASPGPYSALADAKAAGAVTLNYGIFANAIISFVIMAFSVFLMIKSLSSMRPAPPAAAPSAVKDCPYCLTAIPLKAIRCPNCTSQLEK
ncbi:MAG: large conductance mechanosensitive channel protein MscL [Chlorobium sp.]|jgi:large conductance mechanosensitive channel|uniref:large conductance mechanosensitive channel protein MscL n=1 Tax=Chlorobium sp. TaxID=1095 RepID=UPI001DE21085|nr:large conductance mechanosensitive channel protein MscL [Chlorobium sp.]MBN1278557.1 large conductance mechanosensitive channel protein MscL [Chlorobiaceae bacterium]MCF8215948.1 large conductance mechanosensitive channel protein MscL [Chlorobium sp.]MCF8270457.1 large conductance mechanosensitive channel protein MscL [Chlorobium sp.]MCF8287223.1 large conductance mechanosensitive channel protein MscL [Chlorobium sp.]MCF8290425.1 large conductance mechanosensitive channel protein MscL [Chlo